MYDGQEELDNLAWDNNDEDSEKALKQMRHKSVCRNIEELSEAKFGKPATLITPLVAGGFNMLYRIRVEEISPDIMVRLPCPSLIQFPWEKTAQEAATAALIAKETSLPIPRLHFYSEESPVGPYVMMDRVEIQGSVSARLTQPSKGPSEPHVLDPDISDSTLEAVWGQIAQCYLQLHQPTLLFSQRLRAPGIFDSGATTFGLATSSWQARMRSQLLLTGSLPTLDLPSSLSIRRGGCFSRRWRCGRPAWTLVCGVSEAPGNVARRDEKGRSRDG